VLGVIAAACLFSIAGSACGFVDPDAAAAPPPSGQDAATNGASSPIDVSGLLQPLVEKHGVPSLSAVVVRGDGTILMQGAWGVREAGKEAKVTIDDLYHLGSCTKAMTATLCAILVKEGVLRWDLTLEDAFPDAFSRTDDGASAGADGRPKPSSSAWKKVTLLQLLTHRSGMPADLQKDGLWSRLWRFSGEPREARRMLLEGVLGYARQNSPGTTFEYANAGFAVAGHMAEVKAGEAWESLVQAKVFTPLGITSTGFGAPGRPVSREEAKDTSTPAPEIDQPRGHRADGRPVQPGIGSDNPPAIAPAGTVHMTLADWSKFVALHLRGARGELRPTDPLTADAFETLHHPIATDAAKPDEGYACGWMVTTRPWAAVLPHANHRVLTHNGSNTMWFCVVWMAPARDFAVLVACNRGGDAGAKATDAAAAMLIGEFTKLDKAAKQ
jgi:CubicO group peptidase (beta-lactamase class C family)